jgi:hypothetical protein
MDGDRLKLRTSTVWLEGDVFRGIEDPGTETSIADAHELVAALQKLQSESGGARRPLVMEIQQSKSISREARAYVAGEEMTKAITAIALVVGSPLSRALGSFFMTFSRPKFKVKLFTSTDEALTWARTVH